MACETHTILPSGILIYSLSLSAKYLWSKCNVYVLFAYLFPAEQPDVRLEYSCQRFTDEFFFTAI